MFNMYILMAGTFYSYLIQSSAPIGSLKRKKIFIKYPPIYIYISGNRTFNASSIWLSDDIPMS